jgi:thymidylate synthase
MYLILPNNNFQQVYKNALDVILKFGDTTSPRGYETKEIMPGYFCVENPLSRILTATPRKMNVFYGMIETLWYLNGDDAVEPLEFYNKNIAAFSDDGRAFHGAYGKRLIRENESQFDLVIEKLKKDPSSRQAVMIIWDPWYDHQPTKDVPCTIGFIFNIRENKLHMQTIMRSNDVILGTTYDVFAFTLFQEYIARQLGVEMGAYKHFANSFHLYSMHYEMAKSIIADDAPELLMPAMPKTSYTTLQDLYKFEEAIRTDKISLQDALDMANTFGEYWGQWALMFILYKALKKKKSDIALDIFQQLHDTYKYMVGRWMDKLNDK